MEPTSVNDVIDILELAMALPLQSSNPSLKVREEAALAAEVLEKLVLFTLTTHIGPVLSGESFARAVTRPFENSKTTLISLTNLNNIFELHQRLCSCRGSK